MGADINTTRLFLLKGLFIDKAEEYKKRALLIETYFFASFLRRIWEER